MKTNPMKNRNRFSLKIYLLFSSKMITRIYLQYFRLSIFMIQVSVLYDEKKSATKCTYRVSHSFRPITFLFLCTNFSMPKFHRKRVVLIHSKVMGAVLDFWSSFRHLFIINHIINSTILMNIVRSRVSKINLNLIIIFYLYRIFQF